MRLLRNLIVGKVVAKAVKTLNQKAAATQATSRAYAGQYIPASASVGSVARSGIAGKAVAFYEKNPKLVAGAATLLLAALAASLSKGRKLS